MKKYLQNWFEIFKFNFKPTLFEELIRGNKWQTPKEEKTQLFKHYQYIRQLDLHKRSVYDAIVTVMFQWFRLLLRWQEGRKEAWFRLLLVSRKKKMSVFSYISKENLANSLHQKHEIGLARLVTRLQPGHCFSIIGTRS